MRIPADLPLFGQRITVSIVTAEDWPHGETVGMWDPANNTIWLHAAYSGTKREQVFFHELTHAMLDFIGHALCHDEAFVEQLSSLLHQALSGARYRRAPKRTGQQAAYRLPKQT